MVALHKYYIWAGEHDELLTRLPVAFGSVMAAMEKVLSLSVELEHVHVVSEDGELVYCSEDGWFPNGRSKYELEEVGKWEYAEDNWRNE